MKTLIIIILCFFKDTHAAFFNEHASGWHWYEEKSYEPEEEKNLEDNWETIRRRSVDKTPTEILQAFKKDVEHRLHTAILNPTPYNVKQYQLIQKKMMDQSEKFGRAWMDVVYTNPELDYTIKNPISQVGRHIQLDGEHKKMDQLIKNLSQEYGLFFFFKGDCSYCHAFAPIVKQFSEIYGWSVMAISLDGSTLPDFPNAQTDNGMAQKLEITIFPTLLAVQPQTGDIIPISFGLSTFDQMKERIQLLVDSRGEHD